MNGTTQAILFVFGLAFVAFGILELALILTPALVGLAFPLLIGFVLITGAVKGRKNRKRLKTTLNGALNR